MEAPPAAPRAALPADGYMVTGGTWGEGPGGGVISGPGPGFGPSGSGGMGGAGSSGGMGGTGAPGGSPGSGMGLPPGCGPGLDAIGDMAILPLR
jgi:hypothetical protein